MVSLADRNGAIVRRGDTVLYKRGKFYIKGQVLTVGTKLLRVYFEDERRVRRLLPENTEKLG